MGGIKRRFKRWRSIHNTEEDVATCERTLILYEDSKGRPTKVEVDIEQPFIGGGGYTIDLKKDIPDHLKFCIECLKRRSMACLPQ